MDPAYDDTYVAARNAEISEIEAKLAADEEAKLAETRADEPKKDEKPEEKPEDKEKEHLKMRLNQMKICLKMRINQMKMTIKRKKNETLNLNR